MDYQYETYDQQNEQQYIPVIEEQHQQYYQNNNNDGDDKVKPKGLNLFNIPLFNIYNPRNAQVSFTINTKTNDLTITMVPAIPNNAAINSRGPVPSGTKVYDYSKKAYSSINHIELIDLVTFLKERLYKGLDAYQSIIFNNNNSINEIKNTILSILQYQQSNQFAPQITELLQHIDNKLSMIINQNNQILMSNNNSAPQQNNNQFNNENTFSMYRSDKNGSKSWMFVYDPNMNKVHINLILRNNQGSNKVSTTLSIDMAKKMLNALEGFLNNFSTNSLITNLSEQLSQTLGANNFKAPNMARKDRNG